MAVLFAKGMENVRVGGGGGGSRSGTGYAIRNTIRNGVPIRNGGGGGAFCENFKKCQGGGRVVRDPERGEDVGGAGVLFVRGLENVRGEGGRDPETGHAIRNAEGHNPERGAQSGRG